MKTAYFDMTYEALANLLLISYDPYHLDIDQVEASPDCENTIRVHLVGDNLPLEGKIKLAFIKEWEKNEADGNILLKLKVKIIE